MTENLNALADMEDTSESQSISLTASEFNDFLRSLSNLKEICNDVDIRNGYVRQRTNDKTSVFEIDMTPILPGIDIALSGIKQKLEILKTFSGQDVTIEMEGGETGKFIFKDSNSSIELKSPTLSYMDNKYMEVEELERIFIMNEDDLILEHDFTSMIADRVRIITQNFNVQTIQVLFNGEVASIKANTQAKDQYANFVEDIPSNVILENCSALVSTVQFHIDHDTDIEFKMYKDPNNDISLNKFSTSLGDLNMIIYSRSSIVQENE